MEVVDASTVALPDGMTTGGAGGQSAEQAAQIASIIEQICTPEAQVCHSVLFTMHLPSTRFGMRNVLRVRTGSVEPHQTDAQGEARSGRQVDRADGDIGSAARENRRHAFD
jgi:hypothetical protein